MADTKLSSLTFCVIFLELYRKSTLDFPLLQAVHHHRNTNQEGNTLVRKLRERAISLYPYFAVPCKDLIYGQTLARMAEVEVV